MWSVLWTHRPACCQVSNTKDNAPCSTLFVGNLGDTVSEPELLALFSSQPGFVTLKVVRNTRTATAFVDFADLAAAMAVHDSQQVQPSPVLTRWQRRFTGCWRTSLCPSMRRKRRLGALLGLRVA